MQILFKIMHFNQSKYQKMDIKEDEDVSTIGINKTDIIIEPDPKEQSNVDRKHLIGIQEVLQK